MLAAGRRRALLDRERGAVPRDRGAELPRLLLEPADVTIEPRWLGPGYGHRTEAAESASRLARERAGLALDPVYTGKAMAALLGLEAEGAFGAGPVLYWHTHNAFPL